MHSANVAVTSVLMFRSLSVQQKRRDLLRESDEDTIMEAALEAGAEDVVTYDDGAIDVYTAWEEMGKVRDALEAAGLKADSAEVSMIRLPS